MKIIIGCPIFEREWIVPFFLKAIENQDFPLKKMGFVFVVVRRDELTINALYEWHSNHPEVEVFDVIYDDDEIHKSHPEGKRVWNNRKYYTMVNLRNRLLDQVRVHDPDRFFSLDSDILLENPNTISELVQLTSTLDVVSPFMYMTPDGVDFPDVMTWENGPGSKAYRNNPYPVGKLFQADVIMAAKMMSKEVYKNINYIFHRQGEDLGFSTQAAKHDFKLYNASYLYAVHIMSRAHLAAYLEFGDDRGDYSRNSLLAPF